jgi:tyrosyl-tRNA synthetase
MSGGGFYVNGAKATDPKATLDVNQLIDGRLAILRVGKTGNLVVCVDPPVEDA